MTGKPVNQQILEQVSVLTISLANHVAWQVHMDEMTASMYKIIVVGNGKIPLLETVRRHGEWIAERDKEAGEAQAERRGNAAIAASDAKKDRADAKKNKFQIWMVIMTEVIGFIILAVEIALHMK